MPARAVVTTYSFDAAGDSRSITVPGDCEVLEVSLCTISAGTDPSALSIGGQAMTKLGTIAHAGGKPRVSVWYRIAPPTGSQTLALTMGASDKTGVVPNSWTAIDPTTPFDSFDTATDTSTGPDGSNPTTRRLTVSSATGDLVADAIATLSVLAWGQGAGQTELWDFTPVDGRFGGSTEAGAASVEMTWIGGESKEWAGAAWNANAGGGAPEPQRRRDAAVVGQAVKRAAVFCLGEKWARRGRLWVPAADRPYLVGA